jgi:tRNA dimethylallyltransferase
VGYSELFDYFDEKVSLKDAIEKIKQNTRNYAKRQMTWFKKDKEIFWISPSVEIRI